MSNKPKESNTSYIEDVLKEWYINTPEGQTNWDEGTGCACGFECNPMSQMCGSCSRSLFFR